MERAEKYRELAEECRAQARTARNAELRALNLELAKYWDDVATKTEQKIVHRKDEET